jgi:hypothetical protein
MNRPFKEKALVNVRACFPNDPSLIKSIGLCSFEPVQQDWRLWLDEFGYTLTINSDKSIKITKNSYPIQIQDIYYRVPREWAIENNQWSQQEENIEWYLGNDNKLRLFRYIDKDWVRSSTLSLKWAALKDIVLECTEE